MRHRLGATKLPMSKIDDRRQSVTTLEFLILGGILAAFVLFAASLAVVSWRG